MNKECKVSNDDDHNKQTKNECKGLWELSKKEKLNVGSVISLIFSLYHTPKHKHTHTQ